MIVTTLPDMRQVGVTLCLLSRQLTGCARSFHLFELAVGIFHAQVGISDFKDRQDLINACMASCHVPLMLDLKVTRPCR